LVENVFQVNTLIREKRKGLIFLFLFAILYLHCCNQTLLRPVKNTLLQFELSLCLQHLYCLLATSNRWLLSWEGEAPRFVPEHSLHKLEYIYKKVWQLFKWNSNSDLTFDVRLMYLVCVADVIKI
jgi:hypothetical protein